MQTTIATALAQWGHDLAAVARSPAEKFTKERKRKDVISAADDLDAEQLRLKLLQSIEDVAKDGVEEAGRQVGADLEALLSQSDPKAIAWAKDRSGELIQGIDETTRQAVRDLVGRAVDEGWTNDELADALLESDAFSGSRAEMIARTETAFADVAGNLIGWRESGLVEAKEWKVAQDDVCEDCAGLDGVVVPLDEDFPDDGGDGPPLHPNCRCDVLPVLASSAEDDG